MNKIFKVIWSKSKQCYVVVSEIAKNKTGKKKIVVAGIFAALAMVGTMQHAQAVDGPGRREGWPSGVAENGYAKYIGTAFDPKKGLVVGPNMGNNDTTRANGNVATVAIGAHSNATGSSSVAIGGAVVNGAGAIGLGWSTANGDNSVALGGTGSTIANGNNAFAASGGNANGESATAIGSSAIADGRGGVAVGWNAESKVNAVGIGFNAKAKANNTIAIGVEANNDKANAISNNYSSVSIGVATRARAVGSMAMGVSADASGKYSIALGSGNVSGDYTATANYPKATGEKAIAIGYDGQALNINATAVGSEAHATGKQSAAYGFKSQASEQDATAIGSNAIASAVRTTALGVNAQALGSNSVAIGGGAGGTNVVGFAEELKADGGDITRLNRNINIATTAEGDNAVALGYYANAANGGVAIGQTSIAATGGVALGQRVLEDTGNKYASAVVIGQDSTAKGTYSVSLGRQTITKGSTSLAMGNGASANGDYSVAMGRKVVADDTSTAIGHHAYASKGGLAIGAQDNDISADRTTASAKGALAIGKNTKASAEDAVAIGTNAQSTLKGAVALGSGSTTATTATKQTSTTVNGIAYNFAGATSDPNMQVSVGAAGKERQIKNVAAGEVSATSTDAINGSQLFAVASQIKPIQYFAVNSSVAGNKDNSGATGSDSVAIGPNAKAQAVSSIALGNNATAAGGNSIAIGNTSSATDKQSPISIGYGATANGDFSVAIGGGDNNTNYGATANGVGGTALGGKTKTTGGNFQTAVGYGATTTAQKASAFGYNATTSVEGGVALGFNSSSTTGVNKGYNPNDNRTNKYDGLKNNVLTSTTGAIAVGNGSTVTRQITGVAAGTNDTDAVNVAQLKSVNLAFKGNVGSGDVNLATNDSDKKLTIQGDRTYITTNASGNTLTIAANKKDINVTNGTARADAGVADAKNVAEAINNAVSQNKYKWYLTADNDTGGSRSTIDKEGTVKFSGDSNITVSRNGNTIITSLNKAITVDSVKANKTITVGANKITLDGNTGAVTGKAFNGDSFTAGNNVLTNTTLQIGSPTGGNNVTITRDGLTAKAGTKTVKFGTNGINAGDQQINNVASAGGVSTNAANYGDVKNAVSGVTLKINDGKPGSKDSTVNLSDQTLVVKGGTGIQTSVIGQTITVKLDNNTENATTKGIGIKGDSEFATKKYLKDGDAIFNVSGDGSLVTTKSTTTGVQVSVNSAKVKDLAVDAVTVSKATNIPDNPITVTPTAGTNSKDYAIGIDTTKLAAKTKLAYTANGATAKTVSLAKGLNFVNGINTVSSVDSDGKVSFDLNQATKDSINKSATAVGRTITLNADSGTGSSQSLSNGNVSFAVSGATGDYISTTMDGSAVKVSTKRATINSDANTGKASVTGADGLATAKNVASAINSAVNGLSQNLNISDGTKDSSVALKSQKLTITGTGAATTTVNNQTITVDVAEGTLSNNTDGTVKADAAGVATTKNVADVINKTISDNQYSWKLSANGEATTATVGKGDTVDFTGDTNITVDRNNKNVSVSLNKNLTDMNSISLGNARGETIFLNGRDGSIKAGKAEFKDNVGAGSTITSDQLSFTNGATGANESTTTIALDTVSIQSGPNSSALTSKDLTFSDEDGNIAEGSAKGMGFQNAAGKLVQFTVDEIKAGGNKIKEVAEGTADTDAVNVKQLKDTIGGQSLTYRANTSADTDAKSVKLSKGLDFVNGTSTVASVDEDGKVSFDLNTATKTQINTNTTDIATNKDNIATNTADIATNKGKIATNTTNIATNTANIAHTIALADDNGASTTAKSLKDGNVSFNIKGDNKFISTAASGNDVTLTVNEQAIKDAAKAASSFKVKANTHAEEEVKGGDTIAFNNGDNIEISQTGKTFTIKTAKNITVDSVTAGNTVINTSGLTNGTTAITGTGITTDKVTVGGISIDKTAGINAGGKVISNVASGTVNNNATDDSNAANIGDVKQAVANLSQNLNITDGTNNGTVDLKNQKLNVAGANGVTATVNNQTITVGLDANTVNATTKGIGLTADTGSTGNKYLKDGDVSFAVTGDGNLVSTSATAAGVKVAVDTAKVKDLAVAAVTVSKDTQADNPITVTPTAGTNSKDYAIGIDTTKLAAKTDLTYRANSAADANAKKVSLSKGLDFVDGGSTVATVDNDGKVSFDLNTATKNQINTNTTDIATNKGKIATNTTNIAANTTALARNISLGADTGTASSQSLSTADVAFNVKGATGDFVSTNMNGNTVEISTKRATINSNATTGEASVTGNDGLATAQNVADAINKAADAAKAGAAWNITTNSSTTDKTVVKGGDTVDLINGDNIEITQDGTDKKKITVATKKDITVDSVTANNKVTVGSGANAITLNGADGSVTGKAFTGTTFTGTSFTAGNTVINTSGLTNGTTAITGTGVTTDKLTVGGISVDKTDGINAGGKVISNVASGGTTDSNAANIGDVKQAVANLSQNLNITDGTNNGTIDLKNQKLNVAGANGVTATVKDQTITVGLDANTVNATTKGIGLTGDTGSTGNKYLKDGDVSFAVTGDGSLVSTSATAAGVKVAVNSASITAGADGTITGPTKDGVATAKNVADAINAAKKASKTEITANTGEAANATTGNVTLTSTTAADGHTIYDVKLNDKVTLGSGTNAVTVDGTTGAITGKKATIGGVTVNGTANTIGGLSNTTWNGTAVSGRAATEDQLKAATGATTLKFTGDVATNTGSVNLKDDTFGIKGDGKYISTDVNGKNVNLTVSEAEVKKSAVAAVTVSTDTTDANNPLTVTPTTSADGTTKDYKVTIDGTKIANKTNLSYKANDGTPKQVSLADGLNFKNGTLTTASIDDNGVVKYDVNTASITAGTDGTITGPTTDGVATAKNVADAINAAKKASKTEITANTGEAANATTGNVTLTSTTASDGHTIYDVKLNDKVTLGSGTNAVTVDGTTGAITGKTATIGSVTVNGTANTIGGLSNTTWNGTATTGRAATEDQLKAVADAASSQTWNITADKAGTTGAQTGTKKNATVGKDETVELVAGDNLTINQDERKFTYSLNKDLAGLTSVSVGTGTTETIKLDGAIGKITAKNAAIGGVTIDGDNKHVIGLSNTTWNGTATTGRAATEDQLKAVAETAKTTTDAVNLKFAGDTNTSPGVVNLKDDTLGIVGDGKYVSTDANGKNLTVKVSEAEVKKSAVAAVTVSTDTTDANNPISVTPTTSADGTTKDYKVTIDGTKIANKTNLSYKANDGTPKQVSLADGLNFKNGTLTTASIDDNGVVKYDVNTATITAGADGTITSPTTDGVATAQNVADAINAAKKASKTEITANTGEAANATTGNVTLTSTTAADGHTIYDVKLNDKVTLGSGANAVTIDGTAGKATIGSSVINGVNNTFTTGGAKAVTLDGATGTITGTTANIGGVTVNGTANTIGGLSNTTWNGTATTGRAATEDQLKAVADAAGSQTWEITADKKAGTSGAQTGTKENAKVGKDDKVSLIAGENLTVDQAGKNFTYSLNKDLVKMNSATFEATGGKTTVIKGDSIVHTDGANVNTSNATSNTITDGTNTTTITAGKAQIGTVDIDGVASKITTGGTNAVVVNGADGTVKTGNVTVTGGTTNDITGLSNTTVTGADFATKGRAATEEQLKAATGATTLKFAGDVATNTGSVNLKDDTFGIKGDGKYISTDVNGKNVNLTVSEAEVKKSAVAAVTVSTDTTDANNPLTVTPTTSADGTTKDYKVTIDGTKIANKTNLSYKANDGTAKQVSLADGLNFKNGTLTTASIDDAGVVKYDVNTAAITASADGTITGPTTDGVATAQNVADAINAAKKASKTEITANTGEVANATTGNVTLTSTTAADGHTIYDVKLNDKVTLGTGANAVTIDGTAGKATIGTSVIDGVNNTFTTGGVSPVTLNGATGTITGKTANIGGVTVNGTANTIGGLSNTTWNGTATTGRAATEDQLKAVADAAGSQTWEITADKKSGTSGAQTGTKENAKVGKDDKVSLIAGENLTVDQAGKNFTYSLNTDLVKMNSATFEATGGKTTVIKGDSIVQTDGTKVNTSTAGGNTVLDGTKSTETTATGQVIKDGTKTNTSTVDENTLVDGAKSNKTTVDSNVIDDGNGNVNTSIATSNTITDGTNTSAITAGKGQIGSVGIDGIASKITTGGANAVVINGADGTIKTGTVTVTGGTTNDITGLSNTTVTAADFATKGRAATEEQLKAVGEQTWQITADKDATTSGAQTGTKKDAKVGKDDKVQLIAGENMTVNQNERDFTFTLNKDLVKMNSATFEATGGKTTVIKGDSIVQTDGNKTNTATASGNTVANGTKSIETTADGQVIKDGTKSNKSTVDSNVIDDGNGNVNTSNATSNTITDGTNTSTITAGKATIGSSVIDGVNNTFTTGGANAVKLDGAAGTIKTGTVTVTGGTTNDITGLSNTTVTAADFATKGRAATEEQLKAVGEQTWQITADKDATTSGAQTGTKKDAKVGKDDKVQLIAGENMTVNQNERDFTFTLNKDLVKMNSATFLGTGTNKTVITGDSITQTAGTQTNTSTAAGNTVVDGTKSTETTAAGQVIKDGTKTNTSTVDENTLVDGTKSNKTTVDSNVIDDGNGNVNTSNATSNTITDGTNTSTITAGKATIGSSIVDGVNNTFTTGGANAVKLDGAAGTIKTGTVTVTGGTTNDIIGLSNTTVTAADFATKGRAATEEQLKAVGEQTWQITADKDATTSGAQTGTKKDAKVGKDDKVQLIAGENLTVNQNERDFTYSLNKDLVKMNSATFEATGGRTTVIKGDSIVQTDGTKVNTSTAGGNTVADGTKSTETTAAGQVIKDGAKTNTSTVDENTLVDGAKSNKTTVDSNVIDDGNGNVNTSNTTSNTITDGTNTSTITAGKATIGSSIVDGVNNTFTTGGANAVKLDGAAGTIKTGTVTVTGGTTNDITGLSNTTVTSADFATKGRAATEEQLKAVGEQTWQITADKDATTSGAQTGTKKDAKVGKNDKVQLIAGENMTVNQNERDFTFTLNKDLVKMNSATFLGTGTNKTVITGDSITQTAGTQTNTSTAAGNTVVDGTKSTETTAAGQVIKDGTKTNTSTVDENTLVDGTKSNKTTVDSNVIDDGNGNVNTSNATSNTITDGTNTSTVTAGKATIGSSIVDGINNTFTTGGANAVKLDGAAGTIKTGTVTVTGGTTNDITGLSNTTVTAADFATKGRAATEEQLKAVGEQTWQITADKDATTSGAQTGTKKDAKVGKDDKVQLIAGENMTVNQNERDFTFTLNKDLVKMNSATFLGTGTNKTVITGDSITQTAGTQMNTSTAAGNTVADGTKSTATTADGTTITNGANSTATTATGNTVTSANGNTKYASDGVRINTTGKNPVSLTDAGLDNGNNVIKNVASGHVNNDATDNTNAANIADVKKATTTVTANADEAANATKGNVTLTSTTAADGHTIYDVKLNDKVILGTGANAVTIDGTAGKATIGSSIVDGINNTFTTGGANAVKLDGAAGTIKTGTVTVTGGTTNDITGLSNTTVTAADFATKGRAATEEQLKAVGEQTWQITADKDAATSGAQTGTKKDAKVGKDDKVQLIAGENLTVNQNERDFTYSLNKDLVKMNSATFEATGGKTTIIKGDSIVQTAGTQTNTSTAAGNTVADGTKSTETTAAGQVIKDGTKTNTSTVDENTLVDGTKSNKSTVDSNVIDDGNGNVNTSNATSNTITDGTNASTITAGKATIGTAVIDGVNNAITTGGTNSIKLDGAAGTVTGLTNKTWTPGVTKAVSGRAATEDQLQIVADKVGAGWNVNSGKVTGSTGEANGSAKTNVASGEEVQLQAGNNLIIDQNGKTLAYSLNKNLKDMESATFNATGGKTTVIKGDSIVQTDGGKTNTSNAAGNTVIDGTKTTATTAAGTTITDGAKTNTSTADKNVIDDGAGNTNTSNATSNTITDGINTNTATATSNTLSDGANTNTSTATSNTLKNAAGDETKVDAKGATVKDAAGNTTNVASTGATVTNAAGDTTKVEATGTTVTDTAGNKATFTKDGVTITKPGKDTVSLTGNGLDNGNNKIVNVADGTAAKDAVNVSQLNAKTKAATTELTANGGQGANNTTGNIVLTKTTAADGHTIYDNKLNDKITLGAADPTKAITIDGIAGTITAGKDGNAVAIDGTNGTVKAGDGKNAVAIDGVNGSVKVADKITLNGKEGKAGIGTVGIDGKDGIITTGGINPIAVNGKDGVVTGLTNKAWDPNNITSGRAATEDQIKSAVANAGWDAAVGSEGSGVNSTPTATAEKIKPNETVTFKAGNNMMVSQVGKTISYAVNPELTDMKSATFKDAAGNTTVTNGNGMTITPGSANPNNPNAGPVSLTKDGLHNGNNQIKGVAPGTDPTDAVNVSQLNASNTNTSQAINQVAGEVQRVGAHAAAMAALKPIQYDPLEPTQVMAGVGNYRGETAAALGLAHYTNENTMFNIGVSVGGNHNMVNAGVTHKFGYSPEKKNIPDRYKAGPISSVYVMQDEVSSLKKENAEQKYVIADQAARLNSLEAENERQRRELAETKQGLDDLRAAVDKLLASKG